MVAVIDADEYRCAPVTIRLEDMEPSRPSSQRQTARLHGGADFGVADALDERNERLVELVAQPTSRREKPTSPAVPKAIATAVKAMSGVVWKAGPGSLGTWVNGETSMAH